MAKLVVETPQGRRSELVLAEDRVAAVGSGPDCLVRLQGGGIAPVHCEVYYQGDLWQVRHTGGDPATLLNGAPVDRDALLDGDVISVGGAAIRFVAASASSAAERSSRAGGARGPAPAARVRKASRGRKGSPALPVVLAGLGGVVVVIVVVVALRVSGDGDDADLAARRSDSVAVLPAPRGESQRLPSLASPPSAGAGEGRRRRDARFEEDTAALRTAASERSGEPEEESSGGTQRSAATGGGRAAAPPVVTERKPAKRESTAERGERAAALTDLEDAVGADLAAFDLAAAEERLAAARSGATPPRSVQALVAEVSLIRSAWRAIETAAAAAARDGRTIDIGARAARLGEGPGAAQLGAAARKKLKVRALDGQVLRLLPSAGGEETAVPVVDVELAELLDLTAGGAPLREGLGLLLLHVRGPGRARQYLSHPVLGAQRVSRYVLRLEVETRRWPPRRLAALAKEPAAGAAAGRASARGADRERWALRAEDHLALVVFLESDPLADMALLAEARASSAAACARRWPLAVFVHASSVEERVGAPLRLVYEFLSAEEARDFLPVGRTQASGPPVVANQALELRGEYRLLGGDPFSSELAVSGRVEAVEAEAPNVNVALWTSPADEVTCYKGNETSWFDLLQRGAGEPADYFVFGLGYRTVVCRTLDRPTEQVVPVDSRQSLDLPANVLLAGAAKSPLHADLGECLWAQPVTLPLRFPLRFQIDWRPGKVEWRVGAALLPVQGDGLKRRIGTLPPRTGSVTLFTNGRRVALSSLEVRGKLNPAWLAERQRSLADARLKDLRTVDAPPRN